MGSLLIAPGLRALVIDDSHITREVLARQLREYGCDVQEAGDGREALTMLQAAAFQLTLIDLAMPMIDGYGLLEAIRDDDALHGVHLVVVTSDDTPQARALSEALGAEEVFVKPVPPRDPRALPQQPG